MNVDTITSERAMNGVRRVALFAPGHLRVSLARRIQSRTRISGARSAEAAGICYLNHTSHARTAECE